MRKTIIAKISSVEEATYYNRIVGHDVFYIEQVQFPEGSCAVDLGAYVGMFSICVNKLYGVPIYAMEPDIDNLSKFTKNASINKTSAIPVFDSALSDKTGPVTYYKDMIKWSNDSGNLFFGRDPVEVKGISCEDFFKEVKEPIHYLKCNCEGGELFLLRYMVESGLNPECFHLELHPGIIDDAMAEVEELLKKINRTGKKTKIQISSYPKKYPEWEHLAVDSFT